MVWVLIRDAVVIHVGNRHQGGQFRRPAKVIDVKMRGDVMIDALESCHLGGGLLNAAGIAAAGIPGIDQYRFIGGRHDQRRATAF